MLKPKRIWHGNYSHCHSLRVYAQAACARSPIDANEAAFEGNTVFPLARFTNNAMIRLGIKIWLDALKRGTWQAFEYNWIICLWSSVVPLHRRWIEEYDPLGVFLILIRILSLFLLLLTFMNQNLERSPGHHDIFSFWYIIFGDALEWIPGIMDPTIFIFSSSNFFSIYPLIVKCMKGYKTGKKFELQLLID